MLTSSSRCGNIRKSVTKCPACPYIFCVRCTEKMIAEHGEQAFANGCPVVSATICCVPMTQSRAGSSARTSAAAGATNPWPALVSTIATRSAPCPRCMQPPRTSLPPQWFVSPNIAVLTHAHRWPLHLQAGPECGFFMFDEPQPTVTLGTMATKTGMAADFLPEQTPADTAHPGAGMKKTMVRTGSMRSCDSNTTNATNNSNTSEERKEPRKSKKRVYKNMTAAAKQQEAARKQATAPPVVPSPAFSFCALPAASLPVDAHQAYYVHSPWGPQDAMANAAAGFSQQPAAFCPFPVGYPTYPTGEPVFMAYSPMVMDSAACMNEQQPHDGRTTPMPCACPGCSYPLPMDPRSAPTMALCLIPPIPCRSVSVPSLPMSPQQLPFFPNPQMVFPPQLLHPQPVRTCSPAQQQDHFMQVEHMEPAACPWPLPSRLAPSEDLLHGLGSASDHSSSLISANIFDQHAPANKRPRASSLLNANEVAAANALFGDDNSDYDEEVMSVPNLPLI